MTRGATHHPGACSWWWCAYCKK